MTESQPELFNESPVLELWKQVYNVGIQGLETVSDYKWNFSNLDDAFKEGGVLHGNRVYLFCSSEYQLLYLRSRYKIGYIPTVVAIVSPSPPSDKIEVTSKDGYEEIHDFKQMNMDWVPYTPQGQRGPSAEKLEPQIFILNGVQKRADFKDHFCTPYLYNPIVEDEKSRLTSITYPFQPKPASCCFDLGTDDEEFEEIIDEISDMNNLSGVQKDDFKEFMRTKFQEKKKAHLEATEIRLKVREPELAAIEKMRFYKFYPVVTADTPDISEYKCGSINRYYGSAHQVF